MTAPGSADSRAYLVHGVAVEIQSDTPAALDAMDLRLRGFARVKKPDVAAITFRFATTAPEPPPGELGRPVYETPHGTLFYFPEQDILAGELGGVRLHCEPGAGTAIIAAAEFRERSLYFATHPVATVALMELMERRARFSLHAACLADADGVGLLVSGPSGAGKSTLTLALARAGMGFLGDDVVFLQRTQEVSGSVRALGFADALGIGSFAGERFPELAARMDRGPAPGFPKRLSRSEDLFGREPISECLPRVIVFPEVAADLPSAVAPMDGGEALLRLVPDVLITHQSASQQHVDVIAQLIGQARCYAVRSGHDLERAAEFVRALL